MTFFGQMRQWHMRFKQRLGKHLSMGAYALAALETLSSGLACGGMSTY